MLFYTKNLFFPTRIFHANFFRCSVFSSCVDTALIKLWSENPFSAFASSESLIFHVKTSGMPNGLVAGAMTIAKWRYI